MGSPVRWAGHGALAGGVLAAGVLAPMVAFVVVQAGLVFPLRLVLVLAALVGAGTGAGGLLGLLQPLALERLRGRVSLPVIVVGQVAVGAAVAAAAVGATLWVWAFPVVAAPAGLAGLAGGLLMLLGWLPVTMALVLRRAAWPVTVAASVGAGGLALGTFLLMGW
ncbi:MAG: hypothetical protein R3F59_02970 [Myxococcota bacterium]